MLRITIELIDANTGDISKIGMAEIINDGIRSGKTNGKLGDYIVRVSDLEDGVEMLRYVGCVEKFNRQQRSAWDLLYLSLANCLGE